MIAAVAIAAPLGAVALALRWRIAPKLLAAAALVLVVFLQDIAMPRESASWSQKGNFAVIAAQRPPGARIYAGMV